MQLLTRAQLPSSRSMKQKRRGSIDVEHGTFTPLIIGTNGGMGEECQLFVRRLDTRNLGAGQQNAIIISITTVQRLYYVTQDRHTDDFGLLAHVAGLSGGE